MAGRDLALVGADGVGSGAEEVGLESDEMAGEFRCLSKTEKIGQKRARGLFQRGS